MFNSGVLDVVIGLVFIYLLYSLFATIIQEFIASWFSFRAKVLERAIFRMLEDEDLFTSKIKGFFRLFRKSGNGGKPGSVAHAFYNHPLMKFLGENRKSSKPSYINKEIFSKVLIDLLRGKDVKPEDDIRPIIQNALDSRQIKWSAANISEETYSYMKSLWADAKGDIEKFRVSLETWFDTTMERATGWYKKNAQFILFVIGLLIAGLFNVDSIQIATRLHKDPALRKELVQQADNYVKAHPNLDADYNLQKAFLADTTGDSLANQKKLDSVMALKSTRDTLINRANRMVNSDISSVNESLGLGYGSVSCKSMTFLKLLLMILGWIITALAISLGATFWFDLLNKIMKLRSSVAAVTGESKQAEDKGPPAK